MSRIAPAPLLAGPLAGAALLVVASCAPGGTTREWTDDPPAPLAEAPQVAAPAPTRTPPTREATTGPPPLPRLKPAGVVMVVAGDTLLGIAQRYGVAPRTIIAMNRLTHPYWLRTGQRLRLPEDALRMDRTGGPAQDVRADAGADASARDAAPEREDGGTHAAPAPPQALATQAAGEPKPATPPASRAEAVPLPPTRDTFLWPIEGLVISSFGAKPGGMHNDGINIAAPVGSDVRAARNGVVAYAGNELRGYGNLVLIRHKDGWMTAYAHNDSLLVGEGDVVRRGQVISQSGKSGGVARPQVHFEIRRNGKPQNPIGLLTRT